MVFQKGQPHGDLPPPSPEHGGGLTSAACSVSTFHMVVLGLTEATLI